MRIQIDQQAFQRAMKESPILVHAAIRKELTLSLHEFRDDLVEERMSGNTLMRRTGALARSWGSYVQGDDVKSLEGVVYSTSKYAATHEYGDPNRVPVRAKLLAIPLKASLTAAGVGRYNTPLRATLKGAFLKTWIMRSKKGNLILWGQKTKNSKPIPLFVLKKSVRIPARLGATDHFKGWLPRIASNINKAIAATLKGKTSGSK